MIRNACLSLVVLTLLALPSSASAYWPNGGWGGGPWGGYGYGYNYGVGYVPPPPYYAVFPPVYYSSHITARPYGASPYAWPAGFSPIAYGMRGYAAQPAEPLMIDNPYVAGGAAPTAAQAKSPAPLQIDNPHLASTIR